MSIRLCHLDNAVKFSYSCLLSLPSFLFFRTTQMHSITSQFPRYCLAKSDDSSSFSSTCTLPIDFLEQFLPFPGSGSISNCDVDAINPYKQRMIFAGLSKMIKQNQGYVLKGFSRDFCPYLLVRIMKFFDHDSVSVAFFRRAFQQSCSKATVESCCVIAHLFAAENKRLLAQDVISVVIMRIGSKRSLEFFDLMWRDHGVYESDFSVLDSLMRSYLKLNMVTPALDMVAKMREVGVVPSISAIDILFKLLLRIGDYGSVWKLLRDMFLMGPRPCNRTFNALILGFSRRGWLQIGESLFYIMDKFQVQPDVYAYNLLIHAYCLRGWTWEAVSWVHLMKDRGCNPTTVTFSTLINAFCKEGNTTEARKLFDESHEMGVTPNNAMYNALIAGYVKAGNMDEANSLFHQMKNKGVAPDGITFNTLVSGNYRYGREEDVQRLSKDFCQSELLPNCPLPDVSVANLCWAGRLDEAMKVLLISLERGITVTIVAFNSIIAACSKAGFNDKAFEVYRMMINYGFAPSSLTLSSLLLGLAKEGQLHQAKDLLDYKLGEGFPINEVAFTVLLDGYFSRGDINGAENLWKEMEKRGLYPDVVAFSTFIDGLAKAGFVDSAYHVFTIMLSRRFVPNNFIYNSLIGGFCNYGRLEEALNLENDMRQRGLMPDNITFNIMINGFIKQGDMQCAFEYFMHMNHVGLTPDIVTFNTLLDGYFKDFDFARADFVASAMCASGWRPDIFTYNIRIHGFCSARRINEAVMTLNELMSAGIVPDTITYNILINGACGERDIFECAMILTAKLVKMAFIPNIVTINSLLSQFLKHGLPDRTLFWEHKLRENGFDLDNCTKIILDRAKHDLQKNTKGVAVASKMRLFLEFLMYINCDIIQRNIMCA